MTEDTKERIMELLNKDPEIQEQCETEFQQRFPGAVVNPGMEREDEEIKCLITLLVWERNLKTIVQ